MRVETTQEMGAAMFRMDGIHSIAIRKITKAGEMTLLVVKQENRMEVVLNRLTTMAVQLAAVKVRETKITCLTTGVEWVIKSTTLSATK